MGFEVDAVTWAKGVSPYDPHDLADLENKLLRSRRENIARLRHGLHRDPAEKLMRAAFMLLATGPLWPLPFFGSGRHWRTGNYSAYHAMTAHKVSAVCFLAGLIVLGILFARWRSQQPRLRDAVSIVAASGYAVCAVAILLRAYSRSDTFGGAFFWYLAPVWATLILSVVTIVCQMKSPRNPVDARIDTSLLADEDRSWLLEERAEALRVLADRGLLDSDVHLEQLNHRPLGQLHLSKEDTP